MRYVSPKGTSDVLDAANRDPRGADRAVVGRLIVAGAANDHLRCRCGGMPLAGRLSPRG